MRAEVVRRGAAIGIALDGDADRVIVIDEKGQIVDGDAVMAMCATRMKRDGELRRDTVVATVMSNLGLERALDAQGLTLVRTPVGDRYVVEAMRKGGFNLGGEQSGHLIFLDHASTGRRPHRRRCRCSRSWSAPASPCPSWRARRWSASRRSSRASRSPRAGRSRRWRRCRRGIEEVAAALGDDGRVLVRWSGTEPKLRVMVEGPGRGADRRDGAGPGGGGAPGRRLIGARVGLRR